MFKNYFVHRLFFSPQLEYHFLRGIGLVSFLCSVSPRCLVDIKLNDVAKSSYVSVQFDVGRFRSGVSDSLGGLKGCLLVQLPLEQCTWEDK